MIRKLAFSPIAQAIVAWHVVWGLIALCTDAPPLIEFINVLLLATGLAVVVAYTSDVWHAAQSRHPSQGEILVAGIWLAWVSVVESRLWSISWRMLGSPKWLANTDLTTHLLAIALLAGIFHMAGPEAINGRVPTRQWIRIGAWVGIGSIVIFLLVAYLGGQIPQRTE